MRFGLALSLSRRKKDFGYDVSDYCDINPEYGTLADFDEMIAKAHELGLKLMIDIVPAHCSDEHDWFKKAGNREITQS